MRKFMRPRSTPDGPAQVAARHKTNGLNGFANGSAGRERRPEDRSTLSSRYWSGSGESGGSAAAGVAVEAQAGAGPLWEDPDFPATWRALGDKKLAADLVWLRPHELSPAPRFFGDHALDAGGGGGESGEDDVHSAEWTDRWCAAGVGDAGSRGLCAAAAALALCPAPALLARVAPPHSFRTRYTGHFRFRFWVWGEWIEVVVDDRLPWVQGVRGARPLASCAVLPHDYTLPLLEKAYAKLHSSYLRARRDGGATAGAGGGRARALQALTGGVVQSLALALQPPALTLQALSSAVPRATLVVATVAQEKGDDWRELENGLVCGAPYYVSGVARVRSGGGTGRALLRMRGGSGRGAWPRGSPHWRGLPPHDRDLLAARLSHPSEFWVSLEELVSAFSSLELVHVSPDDWVREPGMRARRPWRAVLARRRWRPGYNAGGPPTADNMEMNPQFQLQIPESASGEGKCHVVVSVTQRYSAGGRDAELHGVGFVVYAAGGGAGVGRAVCGAGGAARAREVAALLALPAGRYSLVPHTARPHTDAAFLMRVLTDQHTDIWEVNEDNLVLRSLRDDFPDQRLQPSKQTRAALAKLLGRGDLTEVDAAGLRRVLRGAGRGAVPGGPSLELCRALVALRDAPLAGRLPATDLPPLLALLALWKHVFVTVGVRGGASAGGAWCGAGGARCSSYRLRALLRAAGLTASNKVVECLVVRFAHRNRLTHEAFLLALARLHLAHERYSSIESKMKSTPLSLEEMILMTVYS